MHEQKDKLLHDWVRGQLHRYQPDQVPPDWLSMRRALLRRRWWLTGKIGLVCLSIGMLAGWWVSHEGASRNSVISVVNRPAESVSPARNSLSDSVAYPLHEQLKPVQPLLARRSRTNQVVARRHLRFRQDILSLKPVRVLALLPTDSSERIGRLLTSITHPEEAAITHQMLTGEFGTDSTTYQVLTRNLRRWPDAVIVCDLTTSMYPYTTQLFAWFRKNIHHPAVKGIVFFTDCDSSGRETYPGGPDGQMFVLRGKESTAALPVLLEATRNTRKNAGAAENDTEALLFAQNTFSDAQHFVLVAHNASPVKDMGLLEKITKPVHVVLCGVTGDSTNAFQPDYYTIAQRTRGSLHTIEDDLNPANISPRTWLRVGSHYYRYNARKNRFAITRFHHRPKQLMGFFWW